MVSRTKALDEKAVAFRPEASLTLPTYLNQEKEKSEIGLCLLTNCLDKIKVSSAKRLDLDYN